MRLSFVIDVDGVDILVQGQSYYDRCRGLPHMQMVGSFSFSEVDSGAQRGSAGRYSHFCWQSQEQDEIILLADTNDEYNLAQSALEWIEKHFSGHRKQWSWDTSSQRGAHNFQRDEESDEEMQQQQQLMLNQNQQSSLNQVILENNNRNDNNRESDQNKSSKAKRQAYSDRVD